MATIEECEQALHRLATTLSGPDGAHARQHVADRSVSCRLTDLDVTFTGQLRDGTLQDITQGNGSSAAIKLAMLSDDLLALTDGSLNFVRAWTSGRIKVDASVFDLIKLRKLL